MNLTWILQESSLWEFHKNLVMMEDISSWVGSPRMRLEYKLMNASMQTETAQVSTCGENYFGSLYNQLLPTARLPKLCHCTCWICWVFFDLNQSSLVIFLWSYNNESLVIPRMDYGVGNWGFETFKFDVFQTIQNKSNYRHVRGVDKKLPSWPPGGRVTRMDPSLCRDRS